jgi:hypothetical protein
MQAWDLDAADQKKKMVRRRIGLETGMGRGLG